jgi:hypothetical protein
MCAHGRCKRGTASHCIPAISVRITLAKAIELEAGLGSFHICSHFVARWHVCYGFSNLVPFQKVYHCRAPHFGHLELQPSSTVSL